MAILKNKMWLASKEGMLALLDNFEQASAYQEYLDEPLNWEDDDPMDYETWVEWNKEEMEFFNSDEYRTEMDRLMEKDD